MIAWAAILFLFAAGQSHPAAAPGAFERVSKQATAARAANQVPQAIGLYRQAVRLRPSWKEGWWFLGELLYDQNRYADGRDALRHLVALDRNSGPGFALLGLCEYETKEYRRALADIDEGRRLGLGEDADVRRVVLYHAVVLLTYFGEFESALQVLEKTAKLGATGESVTEAAGLAALRRPMLPQDIQPEDKELIDLAGRAARAMAEHNTDGTQQAFAQLLAKYPKAANVHYFYGTFLLGADTDAGLRELAKELELNPKHVAALDQMALAYEQRGDSAKALEYARRAVAADPDFFAAHAVLGRLLTNTGDWQTGIPELELARKQAPDVPQTHFALAAAYGMAGRKEDAARERAEFLKLKQLADQTMGTETAAHPQ